MNKIIDFFGIDTAILKKTALSAILKSQFCPFLNKRCIKVRKSQSDISIGTCTVQYGAEPKPIIICPFRLLEKNQVFMDCIHLLTLHEPGNQLHVVPEISIPGGHVDYFIASVSEGKVIDFVGVEFQTLDTTGTVWPARQRYLHANGIQVPQVDIDCTKPFGMNWKMTAKTILIQLHHKLQTFEQVNKHFALIIQDNFLSYMQREFNFGHIKTARIGDPMHFHAYSLLSGGDKGHRLKLDARISTDSDGIANCLGRQVEAHIELEDILKKIEAKISAKTLLTI